MTLLKIGLWFERNMSSELGKTRRATRLREDQQTSDGQNAESNVVEQVRTATSMDLHEGNRIQIISSSEADGKLGENHSDLLIESTNNENEMIYLLASAVSDFWKNDLFQDVTIHCGKDGGIVKSHQIVLAGLSPLFQLILKRAEQDSDISNSDELVIVLPDVSSTVLLPFLDSIYNGKEDEAIIDEELIHLEFCHELKIQSLADSVKVAPVEIKINDDNDEDVVLTPFEDTEASRFKSKRSFVWEYFIPVGKQNAKCSICQKIQKVERSSTTYLIRHLKTHHPEYYKECRKNQGNEDLVDKNTEEMSDQDDMDCSMIETSELDQHSIDNCMKSPSKSPAQPVSKFRSLTNQISKLAKHKGTSLCAIDGSVIGGGRKKRSMCWKYFTRTSIPIHDDGSSNRIEKECQCNLCGQSFPLSSSKSTILMLRHLRKDHAQVFELRPSSVKYKKKKKIVEQLEGVNNADESISLHEKMDTNQIVPTILNNRLEAKISSHEIKPKSAKRKQNATLREQKEMRERALVMFSKPSKPRVKTPSVAWIFFDVINKDTARCTICANVVPTPLWNTNGLLRHLKKDHLDECERWEYQNVHSFDHSHILAGQTHPIFQYFKKIDAIFKEGSEGASYTCNHCDIVHVGISIPQQIYLLEAHLKQFHRDDVCREYEMEKVAILCRKRKEEMKVIMDESTGSVPNQAEPGNKSMPMSLDSENNSSAMNMIILQPHEIIQDIRKGLLNVLAGDFFTQFSRDTMQCKLCSAACKVLTNGPNRSNNLWKHLSVSHVDIHERLELERELIVKSLKKSNPSHPIWNFFEAKETTTGSKVDCDKLMFKCKTCHAEVKDATIDIGGHLSNSVDYLEEHLLTHHSSNGDEMYNQYQRHMNKEDTILSLDQMVWIETCSGLDAICDSYFEKIDNPSNELKEKEYEQKYKCRTCNQEMTNSLAIDIDEQKRQHVMKDHKQSFFDQIKNVKQKGFFQSSISKGPEEVNNLVGKDVEQIKQNEIIINDSECVCSKCDTFFVSSTALEYHDRYLHFGERPYACDDCDRTFVRSDELKTHKKYHTDRASQKGAMCVTCGKQFNSATARKRHENTVHLDIRNHICKMCGKKFHSPQALERHSHTHSDEKPFACTECGAKFREKHQLTSHLRTHTGEASITCPNCPQTFKHYAARSKHKCTGDLLMNTTIANSWEPAGIEKVDVSVVTVSSTASRTFKQKIAG